MGGAASFSDPTRILVWLTLLDVSEMPPFFGTVATYRREISRESIFDDLIRCGSSQRFFNKTQCPSSYTCNTFM